MDESGREITYLDLNPKYWSAQNIAQALRAYLQMPDVSLLPPNLKQNLFLAIKAKGGISKVDELLATTDPDHMTLQGIFRSNSVDSESFFSENSDAT